MTDTDNIFDAEDQDAKDRAILEARVQAAAGQTVPWSDVKRWLESWGKDDELPPPPWR